MTWLLVLGLWLLAPGEPNVDVALHQITQMRAAVGEAPPSQRQSAVELLLETRRKLIADHPDDPRRAVWLADQAADLFMVLLPIEGSRLTCLFGLPTSSQRQRATRVARDLCELTQEAEIAIADALLAIESAPGYPRDMAARLRRRRLADQERDRRIPFLGGIGAYLYARLNTSDSVETKRLCRRAVQLLRPLAGVLGPRLAARARLYQGLALDCYGEPEAAGELLASVAADPASDPTDRFAAEMGQVSIVDSRRGPAAALTALQTIQKRYTDPSQLFYRVLVADRRFMLLGQQAAAADPRRRQALVARAFDAYLQLLADHEGVARARVRGIVYAKLATATAMFGGELSSLPPIVTAARARRLARQADSRPEAIRLLKELLARSDLDPTLHAETLRELAWALHAANRLLEAAARFTELTRLGTEADASRSIKSAATIALELYRTRPQDPGVSDQLRRTLALAIQSESDPAATDRWRYEAARLALDQRRLEEALSLFDDIAPGRWWLDAQFGRALVLQEQARAQDGPAERRRGFQELLESLGPLRNALDADGKDGSVARASQSASVVLMEARVHLQLGRPGRALKTLESLGTIDAGGMAPSGVGAQLATVRIDAYDALGRPQDAKRALQELIEDAGADAGRILLGMLQLRAAGVRAVAEGGQNRETVQEAAVRLGPLAEALDRWIETREASSVGGSQSDMRLEVADAYRLAERFTDALRQYDQILREHPDTLQPVYGKAECLFFLGDDLAEAMGLYQRIAAVSADEYYWHSQLRMLQILDLTGHNTHRIAPHIRRLRQKDQQLGGERLRSGFEALQKKYS